MRKKKVPFLIDIFATGLYLGKIKYMPGTFGSLLAFPLGYFASSLGSAGKAAIFLLIFFGGVYVSDKYEKLSGKKDPSCVVIDEIAALFLLYISFPFTPFYVVCGFIFFRIFDILKPVPINYGESLPGGWGIMADDILAVIYAAMSCYILKMIVDMF